MVDQSIDAPLPELCLFSEAVVWMAEGIKPAPLEFGSGGAIDNRFDRGKHWAQCKQILNAVMDGEITLYGQPGYGAAGNGRDWFFSYADHEQIPWYRIEETDSTNFDFENNRLSYPWERGCPDDAGWARWQYINIALPVTEVPGVCLASRPREQATATGDSPLAATDAPARSPEPPSKPSNLGGRPPVYDWKKILVHLLPYLHARGLPKTRMELGRVIQQICREDDLGDPDESTLKPLAREIFERWHRDENRWP